jgi:putative transposase
MRLWWVAPTIYIKDATMRYDPDNHDRRSVRLNGYDYSQAGYYFVTIVTHNRTCLFGKIVDGEMRLNDAGIIARREWRQLEMRFRYVRMDAFVIMLNHIHGIITIRDKVVGATHPGQARDPSGKEPLPIAATLGRGGSLQQDNNVAHRAGPSPGSLGTIVGQFKSRVAKRLGFPVWQRNYYEHVIRDSEDLDRIHRYIESNPFNWTADEENPEL